MKFSLCMIVKNEEAVLAQCLDCLADIMDEIIIVDTGSNDGTKEIAQKYTRNVYDYAWQNDFAAARNFAFSKATGDYIYSADADELIDAENRKKFKILKEALIPEVEIVQMIYVTEQENHPTENFTRDRRPKLFKRLREFRWIEPVHETVNLEPVVYDSDIEIRHCPRGDHSGRDFELFERAAEEQCRLSDRLLGMYLRELYKAEDKRALENAGRFLERELALRQRGQKPDLCRQIIAVLLKNYRLTGNITGMLNVALAQEATVPSAEICMELGYFFEEKDCMEEAVSWFEKAAYDCESELDAANAKRAFEAASLCCERLGELEKAQRYGQMAKEWKPPELGI